MKIGVRLHWIRFTTLLTSAVILNASKAPFKKALRKFYNFCEKESLNKPYNFQRSFNVRLLLTFKLS